MMSSEGFDPYHKWFGIPAHEQPPNHYQLLRVALYEADVEVIDNAYEKEMGNLKQQEHGPHAELVEPLSRELIAVRMCLLDAKRKAVYDAELREKLKKEEEGEELAADQDQRKAIDEQNRFRPLAEQTSARLGPLYAVDRFLANLAGDENTLLHRFLRVVVVLIPIVILAGVIWLATRAPEKQTKSGTASAESTERPTTPGVINEPELAAGQERTDNGLKMTFCWCPAGGFTMGDDSVAVTLTRGFWLGKHEVTQGQWTQVMGTNPWSDGEEVNEGPDYPAMFVNWDDAMEFCQKLTEQERRAGRLSADWQYTLPTEAQWEYSCRAGTSTQFSFGDDFSRLGEYACYDENADNFGEQYAHQVGSKKPNAWKLHDMHGNVWEWCRDWHEFKLPGGTDPEVISQGTNHRVFRGGGWSSPSRNCRSMSRFRHWPGSRNCHLGFRVARSSVR